MKSLIIALVALFLSLCTSCSFKPADKSSRLPIVYLKVEAWGDDGVAQSLGQKHSGALVAVSELQGLLTVEVVGADPGAELECVGFYASMSLGCTCDDDSVTGCRQGYVWASEITPMKLRRCSSGRTGYMKYTGEINLSDGYHGACPAGYNPYSGIQVLIEGYARLTNGNESKVTLETWGFGSG